MTSGRHSLLLNSQSSWSQCISLHSPALRQRFDEQPAVGLRDDPWVEADDGATVALGADEAAEALFELDDGLGQLVIAERVAAGGADRFEAGF